MPPFQGLGLGKQLLTIAYSMALEKACHDLTVSGGSFGGFIGGSFVEPHVISSPPRMHLPHHHAS